MNPPSTPPLSTPQAYSKRTQTPAEEIANSASHGVGLLAALAAVPVLVVSAARRDEVAGIVGASVFAFTLVAVYLTSTLYHAVPKSRAKQILRVLDHGAIFLLIAGTYTPFTLGVFRGSWGWTLFGLVWGLGLTGIILKVVGGARRSKLSICLYLAMGWLIVIAAKPLYLVMPTPGLIWLAAGGIAYTAGVAFYLNERRYAHFVWHLCVLAGSSFHFVAVLWYAA